MGRVPPSVLVREELERLLAGGVDRQTNIVSALVDTVTRLVVQELLEGEQADALGGRGRYERRGGEGGLRKGYERGRLRTAEGAIDVRIPQIEEPVGPFARRSCRSSRATPTSWNAWSRRCTRGVCPPATSRTPSATPPGSAHLPLRGLRDHRPALGGLRGVLRPRPLGGRSGVPLPRRHRAPRGAI